MLTKSGSYYILLGRQETILKKFIGGVDNDF